jgi:S1-C subfamily serine protease
VKSAKYTKSNFSPLNAHADGIVENEDQLSRLKKFRADKVFVKNIGIFLLALGLFAILLSVAYYIYKTYPYSAITTTEPIYQTIEKPVYIDKPAYKIIRVPDPKLSQIIEKPVYITKIIKVPIQITKRKGGVTNFTFFNTISVNKDGINFVVVGASYDSVTSPYPESQWCYAVGLENRTKNTHSKISLASKKGLENITYSIITEDDVELFGSTKKTLKNAKKHCDFFPNKPPIEEDSEESIPLNPFPSEPPTSGGKSGTGFYINSKGYVVTNEHVVSGCSSIWIKNDKKSIPAVVVHKDKSLDIAVIKSNKSNNVYAKFASDIRTGEDVMALGFPLGNKLGDDIKATKGNISAVSGLKGDKDYLQFTAPIQAGNSGGPLLNEGGFVVGINTAKLVGEEYQNINFAINGNSAQNFLGQNSIDFEYGKYSESDILKPADLAEKGEAFTVRILCTTIN